MEERKTRMQLLRELSALRQRVDDMEKTATLRESVLERYRVLCEESLDGFATTNMEGRLRKYNKAFRNMVGYTDAELCGMSYKDLTPAKWHQMEEDIIR